MSGYREALEKAGATVHAFEYFGDYQGTWVAKVTYLGQDGWVVGSYGSCSGCDAFQAEFDHSYPQDKYERKLAKFGMSYLQHMMNDAEVLVETKGHTWDDGAKSMRKWVQEHMNNYDPEDWNERR